MGNKAGRPLAPNSLDGPAAAPPVTAAHPPKHAHPHARAATPLLPAEPLAPTPPPPKMTVDLDEGGLDAAPADAVLPEAVYEDFTKPSPPPGVRRIASPGVHYEVKSISGLRVLSPRAVKAPASAARSVKPASSALPPVEVKSYRLSVTPTAQGADAGADAADANADADDAFDAPAPVSLYSPAAAVKPAGIAVGPDLVDISSLDPRAYDDLVLSMCQRVATLEAALESLTSDSTAAIERGAAELSGISAELESARDTIEELTARASTAEATVAELKLQLESAAAAVAAQTDVVERLAALLAEKEAAELTNAALIAQVRAARRRAEDAAVEAVGIAQAARESESRSAQQVRNAVADSARLSRELARVTGAAAFAGRGAARSGANSGVASRSDSPTALSHGASASTPASTPAPAPAPPPKSAVRSASVRPRAASPRGSTGATTPAATPTPQTRFPSPRRAVSPRVNAIVTGTARRSGRDSPPSLRPSPHAAAVAAAAARHISPRASLTAGAVNTLGSASVADFAAGLRH